MSNEVNTILFERMGEVFDYCDSATARELTKAYELNDLDELRRLVCGAESVQSRKESYHHKHNLDVTELTRKEYSKAYCSDCEELADVY